MTRRTRLILIRAAVVVFLLYAVVNVAVSYTHLDVYKRQDLDLLRDHLTRLVAGEEIMVPRFDFETRTSHRNERCLLYTSMSPWRSSFRSCTSTAWCSRSG